MKVDRIYVPRLLPPFMCQSYKTTMETIGRAFSLIHGPSRENTTSKMLVPVPSVPSSTSMNLTCIGIEVHKYKYSDAHTHIRTHIQHTDL